MPEPAAVVEFAVVRSAVAKVRVPAAIEHLTFPGYAEWSDLETSCADCDWAASYGWGGPLDDVDNQSLDSLERSSQLTAHASSGPHYGSGRSSAPAGFGGGGAAGAGPATGASDAVVETPTQANETDEAEAVEATQTGETSASNDAASGGSSSGSGGGSLSGSGSSASEVGSAGDSSPGSSSSDAAETNLVLSPISPNADEDSGSVSPAVATAPQHVVQALAEAPVGAETVHTLGEPDAIDALLDLEEPTASESGAEVVSELLPAVSEEAVVVPEPASLMLMGLALSALLYRLRRRVVRP